MFASSPAKRADSAKWRNALENRWGQFVEIAAICPEEDD